VKQVAAVGSGVALDKRCRAGAGDRALSRVSVQTRAVSFLGSQEVTGDDVRHAAPIMGARVMNAALALALVSLCATARGACMLPPPPPGTAYVAAKGCGAGESMPGNTSLPTSCEIACLAGFGEAGGKPAPRRAQAAPPTRRALDVLDPPPPPPPGPAPTTAFTCTGSKLAAPTMQCTACDKGTYKALQGNTACTQCPQYSTSDSTGATAVSQCECNAGYSGTLKKVGDQCNPCAVGSFGTGGASATCTPCPAHATTEATASKAPSDCVCDVGYSGTVTTPASKCVACPQSQYKAATGAASCSQCPDNSNTAVGGDPATAVSQCLCNAGYAGAITVAASKCDACLSGTYKADAGPSSCNNCPDDSDTRDQTASDKITNCRCKEDSSYAGNAMSSPTDTCTTATNAWKTSELVSIAAMVLMGLGLSYFIFIRPASANERAVSAATVQTQADLEAKLADLVKLLSEMPPEALAQASGGAAGSVNADGASAAVISGAAGGGGGGVVAGGVPPPPPPEVAPHSGVSVGGTR
jgi:hypothetical protein